MFLGLLYLLLLAGAFGNVETHVSYFLLSFEVLGFRKKWREKKDEWKRGSRSRWRKATGEEEGGTGRAGGGVGGGLNWYYLKMP